MQDLHSGHKERLRQKALTSFSSLAEHEIVELVLNFGIVRKNTNPLAHALIKQFGSASNVFNAKYEDLIKIDGLGEVSACLLTTIPKLCLVASSQTSIKKQKLRNLEHAVFIFQMLTKNSVNEEFYMMCLDKISNIISIDKISEGSTNEIYVTVSEVVKKALNKNPHKIIFAHNHTIDSALPSSADLSFTNDLINAFSFLDIEVFEHIIVCPSGEYSYIIRQSIKKTGKNIEYFS